MSLYDDAAAQEQAFIDSLPPAQARQLAAATHGRKELTVMTMSQDPKITFVSPDFASGGHYTLRVNTVEELLELINQMQAGIPALLAGGYEDLTAAPFPPAPPAPARYEPPSALDSAASWRCPAHPNREPKLSQFGGQYCTAKNTDGTYCKHKDQQGRRAA